MNEIFRDIDEVIKKVYTTFKKPSKKQANVSSSSYQTDKKKKSRIPAPIVKILAAQSPCQKQQNGKPAITYKILVAGDGYTSKKAQFTGDLISRYFGINTDYWEYNLEDHFLTPTISITPVPLPGEILFPRSHRKFEPPEWYEEYASFGTQDVQLMITHNPNDGTFYSRSEDAPEDYEKTADGIILLYDLSDRGSFEGMDLWLQRLARKQRKEVSGLAVVIVGNNSGREDRRTVSRQEGMYKAIRLGDKSWREVNIKTGEGVEGLLEEVVAEIWKRQWDTQDESTCPPSPRRGAGGSRTTKC